MSRLFFILIWFSLHLFAACRRDAASLRHLASLPALTEKGVHAVIEIPAGTNRKIEYDPAAGLFRQDTLAGAPRRIAFLPYPANYGFIPSTLMDTERGGDGDPLDVLVIAEAVPTGTVMEVRPVAALRLLDEGAADTKIIAVPVDSALLLFPLEDLDDLLTVYDPVRRIIQEWFVFYEGWGNTNLLGWEDKSFARKEIETWMRK